jgi:competence protein ComEC
MRYPFIGVLLPYVFGVLLGTCLEVPLGLLFAVTALLVTAWWSFWALAGGSAWRNERAARRVLIGALVAAGWLNMRRHVEVVSPQDVRLRVGGEAVLAQVEARLAGVPELRAVEESTGVEWRTRAVLDLERIHLGRGVMEVRGRVLATYPGQLGPGYGRGARVRVYGVLKEPPGAAAPGLFDQRSHGLRKGITHLLVTDEPGDWELVSGVEVEGFLGWAARTLARGLPEEDPATRLRWAMLLGWRGVMTEELREPFLHSGTMHVFAISGLHISLVSIILTSLLRLLRVPRGWVGVVVLPALWCYVGLTGWQASAVRASVMMSVVVAGWALRRPSELLNSLAGAAFMLLVWDPRQLGDAGFQLSFGVVLSLAVLAPVFSAWGAKWLEPEPWLPSEFYSSRWERVRQLAYKSWKSCSVSTAAWLGSAPLVAWYFHVLTPVSLLLNLLVVPLAGVVVLAGLCSMATGGWWDWATECFNASGWLAMRLMLWASRRGEELPGAWWPVAGPPVCLALGYYGVLLWVALRASGMAQFWKRGWLALSVGLATWGFGMAVWDRSRGLEVIVLPVRGGDCVWVDLPGAAGDVLLDSGDARAAEWVTGPFLRAQGLGHVPVLVLSHGDAGHVGGVPALLADFGVGELWLSPFEARSRVYRDVVSGLVDQGVKISRLERGVKRGPWRVVHPAAGDPWTRADDQALVMLLEWEGFRILFCSDLGRQGQLGLIEREPGLRADVLVAGLPAAEEEFMIDSFLDVVRPRAMVVSCGGRGREGIVSRESHLRLERRGIPVFWTREAGAVRLRVGSGRLEMEGMEGRRFSLEVLTAQELTGAAHLGHHALEFAHFLHHLLHLTEAVEQGVELRNGRSAAGGDTAAAAGIQDLRTSAFLEGHGADHALHPFELLFALAEVCLFHGLACAWQHADDTLE